MKQLLQRLFLKSTEKDSRPDALSSRILRNLIDNFPIGMAIYDEQGIVTYANQAYARELSPEGSIIGMSDEQLFEIAKIDLAALEKRSKYFEKALSTGRTLGFTEVLKIADRAGDSYYRRYVQPLDPGDSGGDRRVCFFGINITTIVRSQKELKYLAYHDKLTGLRNRDAFYEHLEQIMLESSREKNPGSHAVLFCDLDNFKMVNDTIGHDAGDIVLQECARRMRSTLRKSDYIFRLGGDEFTIILKNVSTAYGPGQVAQKIIAALAKPFELNSQVITCLSTSVGISIFPKDGNDKETLLKCADTAMYQAKATGKNTYCFFNAEMTRSTLRRLEIGNKLREVVAKNDYEEQFYLAYQPIIKEGDKGILRVAGLEALLRWRNPDIGDVSPGVFIPIAEETNLISDIGNWALKKACTEMLSVYEKCGEGFYLSVNLSAVQLALPNIADMIRQAVEESSFSPRNLQLELTETAYLDHQDDLMQSIRDIHNYGARLAIDDFGVGYASLAYLHRIPATTLKIDKSFILNMIGDANSEAFVRAILALGNDLKKNIIAEGVEGFEHVQMLRRLGCRGFQGYYFAKPSRADELPALIEKIHSASPLEMKPSMTTFR